MVLDGVAAIGFAAALAGALGELSGGVGAAAPWLVLAIGAAIARGCCALAGAHVGASGSATARGALRRRAVVACLGRIPGAAQSSGEMATVAVDAVEQTDGYFARFLPAQRAAGPVSLLVLVAAAFESPVAAAIMAATRSSR